MNNRTLLATAASALLVLTGCTDNAPADPDDARSLSVVATDSSCEVSATQAPSGTLTFAVTNSGAQVTEFYLLGSDGLRIIGEVENIGPGLTRELVVTAAPGKYFSACKPGMVGEGIRADFEVTDSGELVAPTGADAELVAAANSAYAAYVRDQVEQLLSGTQKFLDAYLAGDDDTARALYAPTRMHWERIEPVAESFGDLDPKMDLREADLQEGEAWTGWHLIEKDLWPERAGNYQPLTGAERKTYAADLLANTQILYDRTRDMTFTLDQIGNGAIELLDEVATGKVTGEEEFWSGTDLWDFQANVEGARVAWQGLQPLLQRKDPALDAEIASRFEALQHLLDQVRVGDGFRNYHELSKQQVKELSDAVNALSEPLSRLTAAVLK